MTLASVAAAVACVAGKLALGFRGLGLSLHFRAAGKLACNS